MTTHPRYDPCNIIPRDNVEKIVYAIFTRDHFDTNLAARKPKGRRAKLKELLKMTMSEDESSSKEEESYESDSDDKSHYVHKKCRAKAASHRAAERHRRKGKKPKCASRFDSNDKSEDRSEDKSDDDDKSKKKKDKKKHEKDPHWKR